VNKHTCSAAANGLECRQQLRNKGGQLALALETAALLVLRKSRHPHAAD
jgi:hypothetical protein